MEAQIAEILERLRGLDGIKEMQQQQQQQRGALQALTASLDSWRPGVQKPVVHLQAVVGSLQRQVEGVLKAPLSTGSSSSTNNPELAAPGVCDAGHGVVSIDTTGLAAPTPVTCSTDCSNHSPRRRRSRLHSQRQNSNSRGHEYFPVLGYWMLEAVFFSWRRTIDSTSFNIVHQAEGMILEVFGGLMSTVSPLPCHYSIAKVGYTTGMILQGTCCYFAMVFTWTSQGAQMDEKNILVVQSDFQFCTLGNDIIYGLGSIRLDMTFGCPIHACVKEFHLNIIIECSAIELVSCQFSQVHASAFYNGCFVQLGVEFSGLMVWKIAWVPCSMCTVDASSFPCAFFRQENLHDIVRCNKAVSFTYVVVSCSMVECCCVLISVIIASLLKLTSPDRSPIYMRACVHELVIEGFLQDRVSSCLSLSCSENFQWTIAWSVNGECSETASSGVGQVAVWYVCYTSFRTTWACFLLNNMKHNNRQKLVQALILTLCVILVISVELQSQPSTHQYIELPKGSKQDKNLCEPPPLLSVLLPTQKVELTWDLGIWKLFGLPNRNYKHVEAKGGRTVSSTQFQWEIAWPTTTPANCIHYIMLAGSSRSLLDGVEFSTGCGQALFQGGRSIMVLHAFVDHHYHLNGFLNRVISSSLLRQCPPPRL